MVGETHIQVEVQRGPFTAEVYSTGQLQAENATFIEVPAELSSRNIRVYEIQVTDLVEEGTVVEKGGFVASLDHSAIEEVLAEAQLELEEELQQLQDARIDTNINMSNLRDGLLNGAVQVEERKLVLEQSVYESPAVKRQAALELQRAEQNLLQLERNYELKERQAQNSVARAMEDVRQDRERVRDIEQLFNALEIKAPMPGMVIYSYDRFGNKIQVGSTVSRWAPRIAELPDLSSMISKTFINEIDISKISVGQKVQVGVDAFPDKKFDGEVITVANIGQMLPNGDTKVFEVIIKLFGSDPELRPAMTTSNVITVNYLEDVLFIPLESVFRTDSTKFVYSSAPDLTRQIIETGSENANYAVVKQGLTEGQVLLLSAPSNAEDLPLSGLDIYEDILRRAEEAKQDSAREAEAEMPLSSEPEGEALEEGSGQREGRRRTPPASN
ncbi:macrolide-specific efflux protein macA precursor [Geofilum rubicundum JCM 15548]|uniref:Macrolide-specific efflux protein macA n=2 Tax=Geofilum TaxID=1236988 RepID=A0A0E9M311_9BACT|nr:macrolide-specific efflux protein macA precursor [Geofilum rubicundum JCM 15548]